MPKFTIESTYRLPVYRIRTYEAPTVEDACRLAVDDDDWEGAKDDHDTSGPTYITGAWEGENAAYSGPAAAVPADMTHSDPLIPEMLAALHAVMRCARGELERPVTQRQPWPKAQRLVEAAIAKAEGRTA